MIFKKNYTTTWHDTDARRIVRPTQLLVYMQETSNKHLEAMGHNLDRLRDEHSLAFILSKIRLEILCPLYAYEDITVETWTCESRGYSFSRFYRIMRGDTVVAVADTVWALISLESRELCKNDSFDFGFEHESPVALDIPTRFRVPKQEELTLLGERRIVYSDLDYNMHMNNTKYADMLCDFMPYGKTEHIKGISLSYLHESAFGDTLSVYGKESDGKLSFRTLRADGTVCLEAEIVL